MYLKKLTVRGFKSFASATTMVFEPGITCIVGPNGSGKSNVVDALAWVMGEQGVKSLRGASMEDVIFAGAGSRAPLGRAEVQLTIDNSDGALPIDYSEVTIARTKFRSGSSEYSINGTPCRLIDVRDLLSDSGIGHEMHVIVGQGRLDEVLAATPQTRREFIEEAAGIHKHRERKDKALRKLDATQANLHRLTDLITEIRRQLKPLGRQAEVAKRASLVQADLRDAKARLLADDLVQAQCALASDLADEEDIRLRRRTAEEALAASRTQEDEARTAMAGVESRYRTIQETWFSLSNIAERLRSTVALAQERVRNAQTLPVMEPHPSRDPDTLMAQAEDIASQEERLKEAIAGRQTVLDQAKQARETADALSGAAEKALADQRRQYASQRESAARLSGELTSLRVRIHAAKTQIAALESAVHQAQAKQADAQQRCAQAQESLPPDESDSLQAHLNEARERAHAADAALEEAKLNRASVEQELASVTARIDAWQMATKSVESAESWVLSEGSTHGVLGQLPDLITVERGYETAIATALGAVADAVAVDSLRSAIDVIDTLKKHEQGRAGMVVSSVEQERASSWPSLPPFARYAVDFVTCDERLASTVTRALRKVAVVDTPQDAIDLMTRLPDITAVTMGGDLVSSWFVNGGSTPKQSVLHITSALTAATADKSAIEERLSESIHRVEDAQQVSDECQAEVAGLDGTLRQADTQRSAVLAETNALEQQVRLAHNDYERLSEQLRAALDSLDADEARHQELEARIGEAQSGTITEPDPGEAERLVEEAKQARSAEMEARLGLRTLEERVRSMSGQVESLRKAAESERTARAQEEQRRARIVTQARQASVVAEVGQWLIDRADESVDRAQAQRSACREQQESIEETTNALRLRTRQLSEQLEALVDSVHQDELARTQQRMRIDALAERAMAEVGIDEATLVGQYGPDQMIPPNEPDKEPTQYVREEQLKRLRTAERDLQLLGRINPLALEEYDSLQARHNFLAGQLEDLKRTRNDLLSIIEEVDARVQEVFSAAYVDVEAQFAQIFARLFPGGEGKLVLTEPGEWLTTGIEIEARPAGKKVKRLSLLSGGERSLVAVCFLIALFKARPSPFYILDEVEAALDDTNLGRLLEIYAELRASSQLLIITHQKRTMEMADVLYGVTMGADGTSAVISQRIAED